MRIDSPAAFFAEAEAEYPDPPVWSGEMYLELHRGTYTTAGHGPSRAIAAASTCSAKPSSGRRRPPCGPAADYPYDELEELWQLVLLQQFHDILPGSSIAWVHQDAERNYAAVAQRAETVITAAADARWSVRGSRTLALNAAPHARDGVARAGRRCRRSP